jgi:hypothetical protein
MGANNMTQGILPYLYKSEQSSAGMTTLGGLPIYLDLLFASKLPTSIASNLKISGKRGWSDNQIITSLIMMNIAGGESVDDLNTFNSDEGFAKVIRKAEMYGMNRKERRALEKRWRKERERSVPSPSVVFRYLKNFHNSDEETLRKPNKAFIPAPNENLKSLYKVNSDLVAFAQKSSPSKIATLDGDATVVETNKMEALYSYKGYKAYQPFNIYWHEHGLLLHSEFRDGNVNAGYEQTRVLKEALDNLPSDVEKVYHRSDTAGYQEELLKYLGETKHERFGTIEFAMGVKVSKAFKEAVAELSEEAWHPIYKGNENPIKTEQEWAEVCFVPAWLGNKKPQANDPTYRYIAIREPFVEQFELGLEVEDKTPKQQNLPFQTIELTDKSKQKKKYKIFGVVTNRSIHGNDLIQWYRDRCGKSEEVHAVEKVDLAGGKLPSKLFGANAAWWAIMVLAYNLNAIMQRQVLKGSWENKRFKALRYNIICIAGKVIDHARRLIIKISSKHPSFDLLLRARKKIAEMAQPPPAYIGN